MQRLGTFPHPRSLVRTLRKHGVLSIIEHLAKTHSSPAYDLLRRAETGYLRFNQSNQVKRRRAESSAALQPRWADFIPKALGSIIVPPNTIPGSEEVRAYCAAIWKRRAQEAYAAAQTYTSLLAADVRTVSQGTVADLTNHKIIQDFATSPAMVAIVCSYLGEMPVIRDLTLSVTHSNTTAIGSQQWHLDYAPLRQLKFYMLIDDVMPDGGPLTWINSTETREIRRRSGHYFGRLADEEVEGAQLQQLMGPAGTSAFLDVSRCLHYGSRQSNRDRISLIIFYDLLGNRGRRSYPTNVTLVPDPSADLLLHD
jgi:hypothetical protein